ncbi:cobalamin-binding protein [Salsuginibacillus kocurii]|uniref:cobalamin-binding protein n=1 Tax=Salsuginibacillus kocurii TaxID=427078 RepID=UPI00036296CE|nr:cobalamin-binding protein [Salsuginibacillus kocurii]
MRLISLCPSNTELIAYLNLTNSLVAVDDFSDWPEEVNELPRLGPDLSIDMDKVEAFQPDLVLASLSVPGMEKNIEELERRGLSFITFNPQSLEDIQENLKKLGSITNREDRANEVVHSFQTMVTAYEKLAQRVEPVSLYWEWWPKPVFTPGGPNWLTKISQLAGGYNIFQHEQKASIKTDWDTIRDKNPDHVCLAWVGVRTEQVKPKVLYKRPGWSELEALNKNLVHILEEPLYCRPSPRLMLGLKKLAYLLHPTIYPKNDDTDPLL